MEKDKKFTDDWDSANFPEPKDDLNKLIDEIEKEKEEAFKEDPYYLGELEDKGFKTDGTGVDAPYNPPFYLKLGRDDKKTFSFAFYEETSENTFKQVSQVYTKQKSIIETDKDRNKIIGGYTKNEGFPRSKGSVKEWLNQLELTIVKADGLAIIKDKHYYPIDTKTTEEESTEETSTTPTTCADYPENIQRLATQVRGKYDILDRVKETTAYRLEGNEEEVKLVTYGVAGLFCGGGVNILTGGATGVGKTKTIIEVLDNFPDQYIYNLNTSPKYIFRDAENLQGHKIIFANDIPLTQANIDLLKAFSRKEDKISYKTLDKGRDGKQERLVLEIEGKYIVIMTFAKNTPDEELANPFYNLNIAPNKEENHKIKGKIAEQHIIDGLHHEGYNIANEINKCCIQWLIEQDFTVFNPYTLFLNPDELNNRDIDNLLSFVMGATFFKYKSRRKIHINGKRIAIGSFEDFKEILDIWSANTEVQKYKLDSIQERVLELLPVMTQEEAEAEAETITEEIENYHRNAKIKTIKDKIANGDIKALPINELAKRMGRGKGTVRDSTVYEPKGTNKPCLLSLGLIDYYHLDNGYGHPQKMLYRVSDENKNAPNHDLTLGCLSGFNNHLVNQGLNQKRRILISLLTRTNILINKSIEGGLTHYCVNCEQDISNYDAMCDFIEGFINEYGDKFEFVDMDTITLEQLDYHNNITKSEGGTLLDTFSQNPHPVMKNDENALNPKQTSIDWVVSTTTQSTQSEIGNGAISENDPTLKSMENAQNLEVTSTFSPNDEKEQDDDVKSNLDEVLLESGVDVVVSSRIIDVIGNDKLTIHEIEQKMSHKYFNNNIEHSMKEKIKHQLHRLVEAGLIDESFTSGAVFCLSKKLKELLGTNE